MYFKKPVFQLQPEAYISLILILAPLMNFLSGINIDIYSPSMPEIARNFSTTVVATKQTISATVLGWTIGALLLGVLMDSWGRRRVLLACLSIYVVSCALTTQCHSIEQLMLLRLIQGFTMASISIGCRVILTDTIKGPRYTIAILYTSIAWGSGPIVAPWIGGWIQHYWGWQTNFWLLCSIASLYLLTLFLFLQETLPQRQSLHPKSIATRFTHIISNRQFAVGALIAGLLQIQIMLYPTVGPFIVEDTLGKSVLEYGNSALAVGACYLSGALISRVLLKFWLPKQVCYFGYGVLALGVSLAWLFTAYSDFSLSTIMIPIMIICVSSGLIFANIMGTSLRLFPDHAGIAVATITGCLLFIAAVGTYLLSHIHINHLSQLATVYLIVALLQAILFFREYQKIF